ncbi:MAG: RagB/SusD family nutrient uptake outer membrane protein [Gemmatimonadetes bacterium]|nr:RagB/SusD family nutrient uptake outer membrane protein [Gemmatimonadota bacterium]
MSSAETKKLGGARGRRFISAMSALLGLVVATGCGDILEVELPTRIPSDALADPSMAPIVVNGAITDFECAYSEFIQATGLWADEFINSSGWREVSTWNTRITDYESGRGVCPETAFRGGYNIYLPLQIARGQAETAVKHISSFSEAAVSNKATLLATAAVYAGYATALLGEAYCEMALDGGSIISPREVLQRAEERLTLALAQTAASPAILNTARVGRARVRLDLGKPADAAADARAVPQGFVAYATYSAAIPRRYNTVFHNNNNQMVVSVDPRYRGLTVDGVADPRVPVQDLKRFGNDAQTRAWVQLKYTSVSASIPMANWQEAQLIIAEAEGGQAAVDAINRLRVAAKLPLFTSSDPAAIRAQVLEERRRELFLQGHRINDMLRHKIPLDKGQDTHGNAFIDNTCLPLPRAEKDAG